MLNVILPFCKTDQHQAIWLLEWIAEMGQVDAPLFLMCDASCKVSQITALAQKAFTKVTWLKDYENINSDWNTEGNQPKSAAGPNSMFRQAVWHFANQKDPWFWLEPDAIPCRPDWLTLLDKEYHAVGKPFMGFLVNRETHPGVTAQHMSGVAIYPGNAPAYFRKTILATNVAFDIATSSAVLGRMHDTKQIFHRYRPPTFSTQEDFEERVPRELAVYHAVKDGSIYPFLRARHGLPQSVADVTPIEKSIGLMGKPTPETVVRPAGSNPAVCDIFIKTREHDYPWLEWCYKSITKFASGFLEQVTISSKPTSPIMMGRTSLSTDREPGYLWQQVCKLYADKYATSEYILYMDSDCVFTRPVTPDDFIKDGKPIWLYTPLDKARSDQHVWVPVMEKFLGKKPEHEFMRRHPFIVQRWMLEEFRKFTQYRHGKSLEDYIMGEADPRNNLALKFSEWNCLGFFLWEYHRDKVAWVLDSDAGPACVYQGFTHGGEQRKQEDIAKFKEILEESVIGTEVLLDTGEPIASYKPIKELLTEQLAIEFLASQVKNNFHKARIVRDLKRAWKGKGEPPKKSLKQQLIKAGLKAVSVKINPEWTNATHELYEASFHPDCFRHRDLLLCIHSYPGANETVARHWDNFKLSGASRIVGIGTTDGKCEWPDDIDGVVEFGENAYMKLKGKDDHLCRRLLGTVKWCLTQPEDHFIVTEYDCIFLKKFPHFSGVSAFKTGGKVNGSKTNQFFHGPWCWDRQSGEKLIKAMEAVLPESQEYPNNSPDIFFGYACEKAGIKVGCEFKLFTRNSLDVKGDLELACEAARNGVHCIHGVKHKHEMDAILSALNEREPELSEVV